MVGIDNISVYDPAGELKRNQDKLLIELNEKLKEKQSTEREREREGERASIKSWCFLIYIPVQQTINYKYEKH